MSESHLVGMEVVEERKAPAFAASSFSLPLSSVPRHVPSSSPLAFSPPSPYSRSPTSFNPRGPTGASPNTSLRLAVAEALLGSGGGGVGCGGGQTPTPATTPRGMGGLEAVMAGLGSASTWEEGRGGSGSGSGAGCDDAGVGDVVVRRGMGGGGVWGGFDGYGGRECGNDDGYVSSDDESDYGGYDDGLCGSAAAAPMARSAPIAIAGARGKRHFPLDSLVDVFPPSQPIFRSSGSGSPSQGRVWGDGFSSRGKKRRKSDHISVPPSISTSPVDAFVPGSSPATRLSISPTPIPTVLTHASAPLLPMDTEDDAPTSKRSRGLLAPPHSTTQ